MNNREFQNFGRTKNAYGHWFLFKTTRALCSVLGMSYNNPFEGEEKPV